jgi:hypothetical protein
MAVTAVTLKTDVANGKTGGTTKQKKKRRRVVKKSTSRKGGVERLIEEADKLVGANAKGWAHLFSKAALDGDRPSVEKLVKFALLKKPRAEPAKKPRRGMSAAQKLGEDLRLHGEWQAEVEKEARGEVQEAGNRG